MSRDRTPLGTALLIGGALLAVHAMMSMRLGIAYAIPVSILGVIGATIVFRGPLGDAIAKRISGTAGSSELPPEQVLNELDELRGRIGELEERADFSERLLAKQREAEPPGP